MADVQDHLGDEYYVLWNDATNCLRQGDYTVVHRESGLVVDLQELTIGDSATRRKVRQRRALDEAVKLLRGEGISRNGATRRLATAPGCPRTQVAAIAEAIDAAAKHGIAAVAPQDYFGVIAMDLPTLSVRDEDEALTLVAEAKSQLGGVATGDSALMITSYLWHVAFPRNLSPWAIFPAAPSARARVISGAIEVSCFLNFDAWFRRVHAAGWEVSVPESWPRWRFPEVPRIQLGPMGLSFSASMIGRISVEGLAPETVMDVATWLGGAQQSMEVAVGFEAENALWD